MGKKAHPLAARIKRIMQKDEDVGKIAQATPLMIARAMEVFLQKLCENSNKLAAARSAKAVTTSHLKAYVMSDPLMDFLKDTVASAPDLPAEEEEKPEPKLKRQRTSDNVGRKPSKAAKTEAGTKREPHVKPEPPTEAECPAAAPANSDPAEDAMLRTSSSGGGAAAAAAACAPAVGRTATALLSSAAPSTSAAGAAAGAVGDGKQPVGGAAGGLMGLQAAHPLLGGLGGRTFGRPGGSKPAGKQPAETEARHSSSGVVKQAAVDADAAAAAAEALDGAGPFGQQAGEPLPGEEAGAAAGDDDMQEAAVAGAPAGMPVAGVLNLAPYASYNRDDQYDDDYDS